MTTDLRLAPAEKLEEKKEEEAPNQCDAKFYAAVSQVIYEAQLR